MHSNEYVNKNEETLVNSTTTQRVPFHGSCPWKCGISVTMETMNDHVLECEKAKSNDDCPFQVLGCPYNVSLF